MGLKRPVWQPEKYTEPPFESNQGGIETLLHEFDQVVDKVFESNQGGIETLGGWFDGQCKILCLNRTKVGLKQSWW